MSDEFNFWDDETDNGAAHAPDPSNETLLPPWEALGGSAPPTAGKTDTPPPWEQLAGDAPPLPPSEAVPAWMQTAAQTPPPAEEEPPNEETLPDWLQQPQSEMASAPAMEIPEGMTYDEWEAYQEAIAQATEQEIALPTDLPEPEPVSPAAELPQPDESDVPDWAKQFDMPQDPFTQPFGTPAQEASARPPEPDLPDWMKDSADLGGEDWMAAFGGAETPPKQPASAAPSSIKRLKPLSPEGQTPADEEALPDIEALLGEEPSASADELPPADMPDWLAEAAPEGQTPADEEALPDIEALLGEEPSASAEELPPADMPDWLVEAAPEGQTPADEEALPDIEALLGEEPSASADELPPADMPDWLAEAAPEGQTPAEPRPQVEDFVERFEPVESLAAAVPSADEDVPAWLREAIDEGEALPPTEAPPVDVPQETAAIADEESLDWLGVFSEADAAELAAEAAEPAVSPEPPPQPEAELEAPAEDDVLETAPLDSKALEDLLGASALTVAESHVPATVEDLDALLDELPEEVSEEEPALIPDEGTRQLEALFAEPEAAQPEEITGVPDIEALAPETPSPAPQAEPEPLPAPSPAAEPEAAQPEWIEELRPSDIPVTVQASGVRVDVQQRPVYELPRKLQAFRERVMQLVKSREPSAPPEEGPLAGIGGALPPAEAVLPEKVTLRPVTQLVVTPTQKARAERLQAILETVAAEEEELEEERDAFGEPTMGLFDDMTPEEVEAHESAQAAERRKVARRARRKPDRVLVALVMLVALIAPFLTDTLHIAADPPALEGARMAVAEEIEALNAGDYVLFAFEYAPTAAGELDPLAQAVLRGVLARNAVPVLLSTDPAGAFHATAVLAPLTEDPALLKVRGQDEERLRWGEDYYVLGYLSGEAVGVRTLRSVSYDADGNLAVHPAFEYDLRGDPTGLLIGDVGQDVALVVVVGESLDDVRTWAEQLEDLPLHKVILVTAAAEPLTTPYVREGGYVGYLAGLRDAFRYDTAYNAAARTPYMPPSGAPELPDPHAAQWHSMAWGALVAALLITLGLLFNVLRGLLGRQSR